MNNIWLLGKQIHQNQLMMMSSMYTVMNELILPVCGKSIEILNTITTKLKARIKSIKLDDVSSLLDKQVSYINVKCNEFIRHHEQLKTLSSEQSEAMELIETILNQRDE